MHLKLAYDFYKKLIDDRFSFLYMGKFDDELTATLMRVNDAGFQNPKKGNKRVSFLIAECFQNIVRHAENPEIFHETNAKPKMLLLRSLQGSFYITTSNLINNNKKDKLTDRLDSLKKLSQDELKTLYREVLANDGYTEKGGGGLGLIEMARKSKNPLVFDFDFINSYLSNFFLQLKLNENKEEESGDILSNLPINEAKLLYDEMYDNNVIMIRKGEFSQSSIIPIFELIENSFNIENESTEYKKKALYLLIELLQNISKHGTSINNVKEGIFIILKDNKSYSICTGNFIFNEDVEKINDNLGDIVKADGATLKKMYKAKLLSHPDSEESAGTGLIEICRYTAGKLKYDIQPVDEKLSFFTISATI